MIRKFLKDIIPKSFYAYLLLLFFFLYVTNAPETLNASLYYRDVEMTGDEYRDLLHVILYYKEICKNELSEENIEKSGLVLRTQSFSATHSRTRMYFWNFERKIY